MNGGEGITCGRMKKKKRKKVVGSITFWALANCIFVQHKANPFVA